MKTVLFFILSTLILASCEHKDLCYDHSHTAELQVVFDWKHASEAAPETMRLYLFPMDGRKVLPYEFTSYRGGRIRVPVGRYKVCCVNSDTESVLYRGMESFDVFEAYAPDGILNFRSISAPRPEGTTDERIAKSPERLYTARIDDVMIDVSKKDQSLILFPELSVCHYRVEIRNVSNLKYISSDGVSGAISGMADGVLVGRNTLSPARATIPFEVVSDGVSTLRSEFLTFGQHDSRNLHKLVLYVIMADGRKNYYTFDVTKQIHEAPNQSEVYIILDGLPLPKPIVNGGGFHPSVDEWQNVYVDIPM